MADDWRKRAACVGKDPEIWFPDPSDREGIRKAVDVCAGCPVRAECANLAVANGEEVGVWAGVWATRLTNPKGRGAA